MVHSSAFKLLSRLLLLAISATVFAEDIIWTPSAKPWNRGLGSHRVMIETADDTAQTVRVHLP